MKEKHATLQMNVLLSRSAWQRNGGQPEQAGQPSEAACEHQLNLSSSTLIHQAVQFGGDDYFVHFVADTCNL